MLFEVPTRIAGIPCLIQVLEYQKGSYSYHAASDVDYYGTCDYIICDRKGYQADWLASKADEDKIFEAIERHIQQQRAEYLYEETE